MPIGFGGLLPGWSLTKSRSRLESHKTRIGSSSIKGASLKIDSHYSYVRHGMGIVRSYLDGPVGIPEFLKQVFGALELERHEFGPNSFHVEMQIGDSVIVIEAGDLPAAIAPWKVTSYDYVKHVDAVHGRALMRGPTELAQPPDKPYEERQGGFWTLPAIPGGWRRTSIHRSNHGMARLR